MNFVLIKMVFYLCYFIIKLHQLSYLSSFLLRLFITLLSPTSFVNAVNCNKRQMKSVLWDITCTLLLFTSGINNIAFAIDITNHSLLHCTCITFLYSTDSTTSKLFPSVLSLSSIRLKHTFRHFKKERDHLIIHYGTNK